MTIIDAFKLYPRIETELLFEHVLKKPKEFILVRPEHRLNSVQTNKLRKLGKRRTKGEPVAYLLGFKHFYGLKFKVNRHVLIPRPETETLVELGLKAIGDKRLAIRKVIDVGTGSGNIIISIAKHARERIKLYATDSSKQALVLAKQNAALNGVSNRIKFLRGNLLQAFLHSKFSILNSIIIANLPYLTPKQYKNNPELKFEPKNALLGGKDGLKYFKELFRQLTIICHPRPDRGSTLDSRLRGNDKILTILLEHDPSQKQKLKTLVQRYFPQAKIKFFKDLSGYYRVASIQG